MTDDPSTNSDEWVWRCKYAASGFACSSVLDRHSILCGLTLATPSPVLDSERPGREQIPVMLRDLAGEVHGVTHENGTTASWLLLEAAGLIDAADAHRCPTPEPSEFILCDRCGKHGHYGEKLCEVCAARPTPERDDLAELRALSEAATDGPWTESLNAHAVMTFGDVADEDADESAFYVVDEDRGVNHPEDTAFIIAAANYVRRLLASHPGGEPV